MLLRKIAVARFCRTLVDPDLLGRADPRRPGDHRQDRPATRSSRTRSWRCARRSRRARPSPSRSAETKVFPPMVVQMINVGEQTGALDQMLSKIADFYEEEVDTAVAGLMKLIEPLHDHRPGRGHRHDRRPRCTCRSTRSCRRSGRHRDAARASGRRSGRRTRASYPALPLTSRPRGHARLRHRCPASRRQLRWLIAHPAGGDHQRAGALLAARRSRERTGRAALRLPLPARRLHLSRHLVYIALLRLLRGQPMAQAYIQFVGDLLLVTGLVYFFGGIASPFSMLYLVVIAVAASLLRRRAGITGGDRRLRALRRLLLALYYSWLPTAEPARLEDAVGLAPDLQPRRPSLRLLRRGLAHLLPGAERLAAPSASSRRSARTSPTSQVVHRDVIQSITSGLVTTDLDGTVTSVNRAGAGDPRRARRPSWSAGRSSAPACSPPSAGQS